MAMTEILPERSILAAFELAWQEALVGGPLPDVEEHVADAGPEAGKLRQLLKELDQVYRRLLALR